MAVRRRSSTRGRSRAAGVTAEGDLHSATDTDEACYALLELIGYGLFLDYIRPDCVDLVTRCVAVKAVADAMAGGVPEADACRVIGISSDTLHRWRRAQGLE